MFKNNSKIIENLNTNTKFKKNIPINGIIKYDYLDQKRVFTWGTGLVYKNFLKIRLKIQQFIIKNIY